MIEIIADKNGLGHITRCERIKEALNPNLNLLIVDSYSPKTSWEIVRGRKVLFIDDLGRTVDADLILDYNFYPHSYLKPALLGPKYAPIPDSWAKYKRLRSEVKKVVIYLGGSSEHKNISSFISNKLCLMGVDYVDITGERVDNIAEFYRQFDLCIGAGGLSSLERAYLGLPTVTLCLAPNQERNCEYGAQLGVLKRGAVENISWFAPGLEDISRRGLDLFKNHTMADLTTKIEQLLSS